MSPATPSQHLNQKYVSTMARRVPLENTAVRMCISIRTKKSVSPSRHKHHHWRCANHTDYNGPVFEHHSQVFVSSLWGQWEIVLTILSHLSSFRPSTPYSFQKIIPPRVDKIGTLEKASILLSSLIAIPRTFDRTAGHSRLFFKPLRTMKRHRPRENLHSIRERCRAVTRKISDLLFHLSSLSGSSKSSWGNPTETFPCTLPLNISSSVTGSSAQLYESDVSLLLVLNS